MNNQDLEIFKSEFDRYRKLFGLSGWDIYYEYKPIKDKFATIVYVGDDCAATVTLNSKPLASLKPHNDIKKHAKHEAIHLLLARYDIIASTRFADKEALDVANEELVVKLTELIP